MYPVYKVYVPRLQIVLRLKGVYTQVKNSKQFIKKMYSGYKQYPGYKECVPRSQIVPSLQRVCT